MKKIFLFMFAALASAGAEAAFYMFKVRYDTGCIESVAPQCVKKSRHRTSVDGLCVAKNAGSCAVELE
ncbi:MAG: hypothetical protein LBT92_00375 [Rickettsiales bacterium]|jgi:hypothetical protein|nr:hypothetical protein [Rickettsiales bacterium]